MAGESISDGSIVLLTCTDLIGCLSVDIAKPRLIELTRQVIPPGQSCRRGKLKGKTRGAFVAICRRHITRLETCLEHVSVIFKQLVVAEQTH